MRIPWNAYSCVFRYQKLSAFIEKPLRYIYQPNIYSHVGCVGINATSNSLYARRWNAVQRS